MTLLAALQEELSSSGSEGDLVSGRDAFFRGVGPAKDESPVKSGREPSLSWMSW